MKKLVAFLGAVVFFIILFVTVLGGGEGDECVPGSGGAGAGVVVDGDFAYPTDKSVTQVTSPFGARVNPVTSASEHHSGVDLAGAYGTPLFAFADGVVVAAADRGVQGFGGWVVVDHDFEGRKIQTVYGHSEPGQVYVSVGETVRTGQHIADMGSGGTSTGPHLHFEVIEGDRAGGGTAVDPQPWLAKAEDGRAVGSGAGGGRSSRGGRVSADVEEETTGDLGLSPRQLTLAKQIVAVGEAMGVDEKGRQIAVATAKHESGLLVWANDGSGAYQSAGASGASPEELRESLKYPHDAVGHDHASVGTFQQQVGFWGTVEELMNPAVAAKKFYEALAGVEYRSMSVGEAASRVQGNATGTGVYEREAGLAMQIVKRFAGVGKELSEEEIEALGTVSGAVGDGCDIPGGGRMALPGDGLNAGILQAARGAFGLPYVWGGGDTTGPTGGVYGVADPGFDCSGLVLWSVFRASGGTVTLPHHTVPQSRDPHMKPVSWEERRPGDVVYVGPPGGEHHVAIYSGQKGGQDMWYEAQDFGVPVGEYPVRFGEELQVRRVIA